LVGSAWSPLQGLAAAVAALPLAVLAVRILGLYGIIPAVAAEMLAMYAAGVVTSLLMVFDKRGTIFCGECGGRMQLWGSHFDPAGDKDSHYTDFVMLGVFALLNVVFWVLYLGGVIVL
jgi:hypothetical protein